METPDASRTTGPVTRSPDQVLAAIEDGSVVLRRSARRRKTIAVTREGETWVLAVPRDFRPAQHAESIAALLARAEKRAARVPASDQQLLERALRLNEQYFDDGIAPASVVWVDNQNSQIGRASCRERV